ncbi:hypothetical protein NEIRO03_0327 [Nematocida sp. AWRm78]|nr:hypothetical protein NEIRO02_0316 [Nematocida sp. AWRm79]KAI5182676.1 hypothetical protein NEIRO03_0327 [Nematocida sp. AWRm78]
MFWSVYYANYPNIIMRPEKEESIREEFFRVTDDLKVLLGVIVLFILNYIFALYVELKPHQTEYSYN